MAASRGDSKEVFAITRALAGVPPKQAGAVNDENGVFLTEHEDVVNRWTRHFAGVFCAAITTDAAAKPSSVDKRALVQKLSKQDTYATSLQDTHKLIHDLPQQKGCGLDSIPAEVLQAGGIAVARFVYGVVANAVAVSLSLIHI